MDGKRVTMNNIELDIVKQYTYLGVKLNNSLDFNEHGTYLYNSALQMSYALYNIRNFIDSKTVIIIFKSFILSRHEYGALFCVEANASVLNKLQKLVNRCLRTCFKLSGDANVYQLHIQAKLLPLKIRRNIHVMKIMFKQSKNSENVAIRSRSGMRSNKCPVLKLSRVRAIERM